MPELPEVETTLRAVGPILKGRRFDDIEVLQPNMVLHDKNFADNLRKRRVQSLERRGKYMLAHLDNGTTLILHLKMSGRLGVRIASGPELTYERIRFTLDDKRLLIFNDPRTLGRAMIHATAMINAHPGLKSLGPDALSIDEQTFLERLKRKGGAIKSVLMDQSFIAGIGNIYAQEACFVAKIDPCRKVGTLTTNERKKLHKATIATLEKGIANMGTSFSDFADLFGKPGRNQKELFVYGRAGKPCLRCGTTLSSCILSQRSTVWCSSCQK